MVERRFFVDLFFLGERFYSEVKKRRKMMTRLLKDWLSLKILNHPIGMNSKDIVDAKIQSVFRILEGKGNHFFGLKISKILVFTW